MISFRPSLATVAIAFALSACGAEKPVADVPPAETAETPETPETPEPVETPVETPDAEAPTSTCVQEDGTVDLECCRENQLRPEGCTPCSPDRETACLTCRQAGQIISPEAEVACCEAYRLRGDERCPHDD